VAAYSYSLAAAWSWFIAFRDVYPRATEAVMDFFGILPAAVAFKAARDQNAWNNFKRFTKAVDAMINRAERNRPPLCKIAVTGLIATLIESKSKYLTTLGLDELRVALLSWKSSHRSRVPSEETSEGTQLLLEF
jgi:hypothetical protein